MANFTKIKKKYYKIANSKKLKKKAQEHAKGTPKLTAEEKKQIDAVWGKYQKVNYDWFRFYKHYSGKFSPYFIPDDAYVLNVSMELNNAYDIKRSQLQEKNYFDLLIPDIKKPVTVARRVNGLCMDKDYKIITKEEVIEKCLSLDDVVVKPSWMTSEARGVEIFYKDDENFEKKVIDSINSIKKNFIIQRVMKQHPALKALNPDAINTIRILTLYWNGEIKVLASLVRIGTPGCRVDNLVRSNGVSCAINLETGEFVDTAYDKFGKAYKKLENGIEFAGYKIPSFFKLVEEAKRLHPILSVNRLLGWDFSVDEEGEPQFIEANMLEPAIYFHQISTGPLLGEGELFKEIMDYVYDK